MSHPISARQPIGVYARWRPLTDSQTAAGEIVRGIHQEKDSLVSVSINRQSSSSDGQWTSQSAFRGFLSPQDDNSVVFNTVVAPSLAKVLQGSSCNFFAYGHSGSGKTHTIIGYDYEQDCQLGLCLAAAHHLFESLESLNQTTRDADKLGIGFSLFEVRKNSAFDLLNKCTQYYIREGYDGKTHIRGPTEILDGKVRVQPIVKYPCWTYDEFRKEFENALELRAVGSSSVHDRSSRTHAVFELEIITATLVEARQALYDRESDLVPVSKHTRQSNQLKRTPFLTNAEGKARVTAAQNHIASILSSIESLGGRLVFVDLAGAEYQQGKGSAAAPVPKQTPQERLEGRQINQDLFALKEVIRACASGQTRIPFRSSSLTMVLREHFLHSKDGSSAMILTVSPAKDQYEATLNSLKYGSLVGAALT